MPGAVTRYLDDVRSHLRLDRPSETEVISELETHIEDRLTEMTQAGLSEEEATHTCLRLLGSARLVARQIYEAHSQGSWGQALMGGLPHVLFALLFALNWWQGVGWLAVVLGAVLSTALYGWLHGRPVWLFPWLGCMLLPAMAAGVLLMYLPRGWSWLAVVAYVPLALWLICSVTIHTIRRDWLYGTLMLLPVPVVIGWALSVADRSWFLGFSPEQIGASASRIGMSFIVLAITAVAFIRLRQRWLRVALLYISGLFSLIMVASYAGRGLSLSAFLLLNGFMLALLLTPALIERRLKQKEMVRGEFVAQDPMADAGSAQSGG